MREELPGASDGPRVIDAWIERKWEAQGLVATGEADRAALARRLHLDLIGLPPTERSIEKLTPVRLAEVLTQKGLVATEAITDALYAQEKQGEAFCQVLVNGRHITEWDLTKVVTETFQLPFLMPTTGCRGLEVRVDWGGGGARRTNPFEALAMLGIGVPERDPWRVSSDSRSRCEPMSTTPWATRSRDGVELVPARGIGFAGSSAWCASMAERAAQERRWAVASVRRRSSLQQAPAPLGG